MDEKTAYMSIQYYECFVNIGNAYRRYRRAMYRNKMASAKKYALKVLEYYAMSYGIEKVCTLSDEQLGRLQHWAYMKNREGLPINRKYEYCTNSGYGTFLSIRDEAKQFILTGDVDCL